MSHRDSISERINYRGTRNPKQEVAACITERDVRAAIVGEDYHLFPDSTLTVCMLRLRNGFTVLGESACASPENFDLMKGREIARRNACDKIWPLLGYELRGKMLRQNQLEGLLKSIFN